MTAGYDAEDLYPDEDDEARPPLYLEVEDALVDRLTTDPRVRVAAIVAYTFHLDPITVLAESDRLNRLLRLAATRFIQDEEKRAHDRADAEARRNRPT